MAPPGEQYVLGIVGSLPISRQYMCQYMFWALWANIGYWHCGQPAYWFHVYCDVSQICSTKRENITASLWAKFQC
jgi:hypothetical protein